jgi:hypothetical protein
MAVLWLANTSLVTPQILTAAEAAGASERLPADGLPFLTEVRARNRERNRRLFAQLADALRALNAANIEPALLKGAALWVAQGRPATFDRMLNDLDLLVRPDEAETALAALKAAGFELHNRYQGSEVHVFAELGRPSDVGFLDLHQRAPGPPGAAEAAWGGGERRVAWDGVAARVAEPAAQIFQLVLHDQFHDGDYWRGTFDLRHLLDIAALAEADPDWAALNTLASTPLLRRALEAQLLAARDLAGAAIPQRMLDDRLAGLQHRRRLAQFAHPALAGVLAAAGAAIDVPALLAHRAANRRDRRRLFGEGRATVGLRERLDRLRQLAAGPAAGKA